MHKYPPEHPYQHSVEQLSNLFEELVAEFMNTTIPRIAYRLWPCADSLPILRHIWNGYFDWNTSLSA